MGRMNNRLHVVGQRICEKHQTLLDDACWCGVIHGPVLVEHVPSGDCVAGMLEDLLTPLRDQHEHEMREGLDCQCPNRGKGTAA